MKDSFLNIPDIIWDFLDIHQMKESWRELNSDIRDYTYYSSRHNSYSRLDYIFVTQDIQTELISASIEPKILSNHAAVKVCWRREVVIHCK